MVTIGAASVVGYPHLGTAIAWIIILSSLDEISSHLHGPFQVVLVQTLLESLGVVGSVSRLRKQARSKVKRVGSR